jgi:hypothetical protein
VEFFGFPAVGAILAVVDPLLPPGEDSRHVQITIV